MFTAFQVPKHRDKQCPGEQIIQQGHALYRNTGFPAKAAYS